MPRSANELPDKICPICGRAFNRNRFNGVLEDSMRYLSRKTCSQSCGNTLLNPTDRTTYHLRAKKFKKPICEMCGKKTDLDTHHRDGNIKNNISENILTLCHSCHMKLHWIQRKELKRLEKIGWTDLNHSETP